MMDKNCKPRVNGKDVVTSRKHPPYWQSRLIRCRFNTRPPLLYCVLGLRPISLRIIWCEAINQPNLLLPPCPTPHPACSNGAHETHTICGTPNYMAPEVQDSGYGLSADLWSAGCLLYTMMTGVAPFQGRLVGETLSKARTGRYVEPEGLSDAASDFLASMLELVSRCDRRVLVVFVFLYFFVRPLVAKPSSLIYWPT